MKALFKKADKKFAEIGLVKLRDDKFIVAYERRCEQPADRLTVVIDNKIGKSPLIKIFDWAVYSTEEGRITHDAATYVTAYELKLILRKMKEKGWLSK